VSEPFTIRRATTDDIEALVELRLALQSENDAHENRVDWATVGEACRRYFAESMPADVFVIFVAEARGASSRQPGFRSSAGRRADHRFLEARLM